jgi:hypothetical protein
MKNKLNSKIGNVDYVGSENTVERFTEHIEVNWKGGTGDSDVNSLPNVANMCEYILYIQDVLKKSLMMMSATVKK